MQPGVLNAALLNAFPPAARVPSPHGVIGPAAPHGLPAQPLPGLLPGHPRRADPAAPLRPDATAATRAWQQGALSNFDYLMRINSLAGRTYSDLTQARGTRGTWHAPRGRAHVSWFGPACLRT